MSIHHIRYEFDDSTVTKVDPATVMNSEAYVLFYRKSGAANEAVRERAQSLLAQSSEAPSLVQFWVSRQWMNKFETFAEPGPIDNSDFLCHHGGVLPTRTDYVYELCVALPQSLWDHLHSTFGGGPACTRLYECANCRAELDALTRQKKFELEEFKTLHQEFQEQETPSAIFCLSSSWFKVWEGFVTGRKREVGNWVPMHFVTPKCSFDLLFSTAARADRQQSHHRELQFRVCRGEAATAAHVAAGGGLPPGLARHLAALLLDLRRRARGRRPPQRDRPHQRCVQILTIAHSSS